MNHQVKIYVESLNYSSHYEDDESTSCDFLSDFSDLSQLARSQIYREAEIFKWFRTKGVLQGRP